MKPLKILAAALEYDRSEAYMLAELAKAGHSIKVLTSKEGTTFETLQNAPVQVMKIQFKSRFDFFSIAALKKELAAEKYDIVHCFSARTLTCALFAGVPKHSALVTYRGTIGRLGRIDPISYISFFNPRIDAIVCVSAAVKKFLAKYIPTTKLSVIHKGHDPLWYQAKEQADFVKLGIPQKSFVMTCIANDRPVKGLRYAVDSLRYLPEDTHLLIIGRISGAETFIESSPNRNRIHLAGFQKNPEDLLASSDALIVPSIAREGLPRVLIEGWSTGVPIVATAVGGIPEVIVDEHSGLLVPPKSGFEIASAVTRFRNDPGLVKKVTENGRARIQEKFSIEKTIAKTLEVYYKAIQRRGDRGCREFGMVNGDT